MDEPYSIAHPFLALAWIGAGSLLFAGVLWLDLYRKMARLRLRGGGSGIDPEALQLAAMFTGMGLITTVVGIGLHFGL